MKLYKSLLRPHLDWIIGHLTGTGTIASTESYLRGFSIVSLDCFRNYEDCHMMKDFGSWICGL